LFCLTVWTAGGCAVKNVEPTSVLEPVSRPESAGVDAATLRAMEHRVEVALKRGDAPGAVLLVARKGKIVLFRAYESRQTDPNVAMTPDTVFDVASLSKIVGTATATMLLLEDGKLHLDDPVKRYLPEFAAEGKDNVTLRDLLAHRSGLKAYESVMKVKGNELAATTADNLVKNLASLPLLYPTGEYTLYSCLNYLILARVNEIAAGESQESLLRRRVWEPLGMSDTAYLPTYDQRPRLAPTIKGAAWAPGVIHDPLANYHGSSAAHCPGNAGLFSTAHDLAVYCQMILNGGSYGGVQVLLPETVAQMTSPQSVLPEYDARTGSAGEVERRGLGWIVYREKPYVSPAAPDGSFIGHTGYTGTYLWIDKHADAFIVFLTNAVYAQDPPQIQECRKEVTQTFVEGLYGGP